MNGRIIPRSWRFDDNTGKAMPFEFQFEEQHNIEMSLVDDLASHAPFIAELQQILVNQKLAHILGLVALTPDYLPSAKTPAMLKCERTIGRANLVFSVGAEALKDKDKRTSIWTFGKSVEGGQESMLCFSGCMCQR